MIAAVDIGGTKTLVALFDSSGKICSSERFATPKNYKKFLVELAQVLAQLDASQPIESVGVGLPGKVDHQTGTGLAFGNLPWHDVAIKKDFKNIFKTKLVTVENDAKAAALWEALLVKKQYKKVLYITIGTGIGDGIIINGIIEPAFANSEAGQMVLQHDGKLRKWEDFASGKALAEKYGRRASQINDERIWYRYAGDLAQGIDVLVAALDPEVIIIGGGIGAHFEKFGHFLVHRLKKYENNMVKMPPIIAAKHPEEAVIYGAYVLAHQALN